MKANKFFAVAMAALALVACKPGEKDPEQKLSLDKTTLTLAVDESKDIKANIAAVFTVDVEDVVELIPANDGKSVKVTGVKEGKATITATAGDKKATCAVTVTKGGDDPEEVDYSDFKQLQGKEYFVFFLQEGAVKYLGDKVIYHFGPNDNQGQGSRWLYDWDATFSGPATAVGTDPFDGGEGWVAMGQANVGWAGCGLCVAINDDNNKSGEGAAEDLAGLNEIHKHVTNYDEWYLAVAMKNSVQGAGYDVQLIGSNVKGADGKGVESGNGVVNIAPKATGEWDYQEFQLSKIQGLEFGEFTTNGSNILTIVANPYKAGTQLDLGYAFIYKK